MYPNTATVKIWKKSYQEKWENAYLRVKNARASRALSCTQANIGLLRSPDSALLAKSREKFLAPPNQILDPLLPHLSLYLTFQL